jgi:prepilin-type N-terminal cleavage/methylation domain-containing protein
MRETCAVKRRSSNDGFSLLEMLIVISISLTLAGITAMTYVPMMKQQRITNAYNSTLTTLRRTRDQAAGDMRVYVVSFTAPGTITVTQNTTTGPVLVTTVLPSDVTFHVEPGVPTSPTAAPMTPDGFGSAANAIDFDQNVGAGGATTIYFYPDGTAQDINGNVNSGVVYLGQKGDLYSSRAITLWGNTGRIRGWRLYNVGGAPTWRQQ